MRCQEWTSSTLTLALSFGEAWSAPEEQFTSKIMKDAFPSSALQNSSGGDNGEQGGHKQLQSWSQLSPPFLQRRPGHGQRGLRYIFILVTGVG